MGLLDRFKKKPPPASSNGGSGPETVWDMEITEIWKISDLNTFVVALNGWLARKCQYGSDLAALTPEEKTVYIVDSFQVEVNNGGFSQYLYNSSGALATELPAALSAVGAARTAEIYQRAFAYLPAALPADDVQRGDVLDACISDEAARVFDACDAQFYDAPNELDGSIRQYAMNNRDAFA